MRRLTTVSSGDVSDATSTTTAHASGTLAVALTNTAVSTVIFKSNIGVIFDETADLLIGGTPVRHVVS